MQHYTYLFINLGTIAAPFAFSFYPRFAFYRQWPAFIPAVLVSALFYVVWDALFTHLGVWGFNKTYVTGLYMANLPVEEVMFFICIPYACSFTLHCFDMVLPPYSRWLRFESVITPVLIVSFAAMAVLHYNKLYTASAFAVPALLLAWAKYITRVQWLSHFYVVYIVIQLPFFIVNGLLTGHWLDAPVVWYNNNENLGIRLTTIPLEDIFYGMGLLLLNNMLYNYFLNHPKFATFKKLA